MNGTDNNSRAAALRPQIDSLTTQLCAVEANLLQAVIAYTSQGLHKECDGFSGIRDWIKESFSLNEACAGQIASIARLSPKFKHLTEAALSGAARIDAIAYAMRRIEREGLAVYSRVPYPTPVESPYGATCRTPEELIREYCVHATRSELAEHLDRICAELFDQQALLTELSQQSLAWLEVNQRPDGMWDIEGLLTDDTGKLLSNALRTAVPPPRQEDKDDDGLLPRDSGRNAEALHQMVAAYGTAPDAPRRHGHTATLNLTCDVETLRGDKTGRLPKLDGKTVSVSKARLLACEAGVIPSVFDYSTGEAIELGRTKRLPNVALRHKLELEQPEGCAWSGCRAPISWTEAHHIEHWANGGETTAENLILLCRFHHGRIHLDTWEITKTAPGKAVIRHIRTGATDAEWDAEADLPTGQSAEEFSPNLKRQLDDYATWFAQKNMEASIARTRERFREKDAAEVKACTAIEEPFPALVPAPREDPGDPPFLTRPQRATAEGSAGQTKRSPFPPGGPGPSPCPGPGSGRTAPAPNTKPRPSHYPFVVAGLKLRPDRAGFRRAALRRSHLVVAARLKLGPTEPESRRTSRPNPHPSVAVCPNQHPPQPKPRNPPRRPSPTSSSLPA
jgi:hypothetical protein